MTHLLYYLVIKPLSFLPMFVLYRVSDLLYWIIFHLVGYRKKVVYLNLRNSFPDQADDWIHHQAKQFYRHLCDLVVESLKLFSISKREALKRFQVKNPEVVDRFFQEGRSVVAVGGHYNNWEWLAVALPAQIQHPSYGIYSPLKNAFFNKKMKESRSRFGLELISTKDVLRFYADPDNHPSLVLFGADQSPTYSKNVHWMEFLHQETAVMLGTERFARKYNIPVVFGSIQKEKRGHYTFQLEVLFEDPVRTQEGEITEAHTRRLEEQIRQNPAFWLWSHKRWKRKRDPQSQ
jgi:KDO2-lipid IV(A) lauroyltransferase